MDPELLKALDNVNKNLMSLKGLPNYENCIMEGYKTAEKWDQKSAESNGNNINNTNNNDLVEQLEKNMERMSQMHFTLSLLEEDTQRIITQMKNGLK